MSDVSVPFSYRYYMDEKGNRYFHSVRRTTKRVDKDGMAVYGQRGQFVAGIARYYKTYKTYKVVKMVAFAKKRRAIDWALTQMQKARKECARQRLQKEGQYSEDLILH